MFRQMFSDSIWSRMQFFTSVEALSFFIMANNLSLFGFLLYLAVNIMISYFVLTLVLLFHCLLYCDPCQLPSVNFDMSLRSTVEHT